MKKLLLPVSLLALLAACGSDSSPTSPAATSAATPPPRPNFDDIANDIDASIDAIAEAMPLNVGGANGTTVLYVTPRNGDGKSGCNLTGSTTLVVSVASSNTMVATVSPSSVTFESCGDLKTLTVTPVGAGSATISITQTSNNSGGSFNLAPASFTVNVTPPPNTAPTVAVAGVTAGASYHKGSVPAATCQVTDAEDGPSSFTATLSAITGPYAADGIGSQTASCSYTDGGGLIVSASETYGIVDPSPPTIGYTLSPASPDGNADWYKSNVTLTWNVSDPQSPNSLTKTGCANQNITTDQAETTYSCSATSAGGSAGPVEVKIKRDATPPTVSLMGGPAAGGSYYFGSVPAAPTCAASDGLSGLDGNCVVSGYANTVGTHTVKATAKDNAGNTNEASATYTVLAWTLNGFYAPVDMPGTSGPPIYNTVKGGQTVPLKFNVLAGLTEQTTTAAVQKFSAIQTACDIAATVADVEVTNTGGTSLRYDTIGGQFIQNWQTPKKPGECYRVTILTADGSTIWALFKLK
jgi:hypothetical protein